MLVLQNKIIMKKFKKDSLFNKKRFEWLEKNRIKEIRSMTKKDINKKLKDILLFSERFKNNYVLNNPVSYEILLRKK
ncbi:MAG: hypothetical protein A2474_03130 [Elusimicrobia bacterium RIFOXYC2_FULL_34_12]|nr:MAG: hypothetical protein A2474_03130 [Elusimicrobia bacterium RIFOXYC2_FULL_34_12]OGS38837.1 MAG: hypothetical protein A2551_03060 [Elusimicrobia bacterium RIFOXYD2_FULL_34_30]HAM38657.1 hypothetical protein [Elusimicrobiota bacterium]